MSEAGFTGKTAIVTGTADGNNARGAFLRCREAFRRMAGNGVGAIVCTTSEVATIAGELRYQLPTHRPLTDRNVMGAR
ncbi:hypothetical protein [Amycolatopsis pigmentata]|uniref:Uncharacterized protein n=1 Tax=Amycolatopsis pigmentata TaxID=450801 RepID=A0ABW5FLF3_9PSEU